MPKISVIIPVYNVEEYLPRCLESVCNQTLPDIEIICINDASPDNSLEILKTYANRDARIKIIDFKENQGVSIARNTAINQAQGEYIGFVDPDDWVDLDFYENLYNKALKNKADIVKADIKEICMNNTIKKDIFNINQKLQDSKWHFFTFFWDAIYRKNLILENRISFDPKLTNGEDGVFLTETLSKAQKIYHIDNTYYNVFKRENSASSDDNFAKKAQSLSNSYTKIIEIVNTEKLDFKSDSGYNALCFYYFDNCIKNIFRTFDIQIRSLVIDTLFLLYQLCQNKEGGVFG